MKTFRVTLAILLVAFAALFLTGLATKRIIFWNYFDRRGVLITTKPGLYWCWTAGVVAIPDS